MTYLARDVDRMIGVAVDTELEWGPRMGQTKKTESNRNIFVLFCSPKKIADCPNESGGERILSPFSISYRHAGFVGEGIGRIVTPILN